MSPHDTHFGSYVLLEHSEKVTQKSILTEPCYPYPTFFVMAMDHWQLGCMTLGILSSFKLSTFSFVEQTTVNHYFQLVKVYNQLTEWLGTKR